MKKLALAVAVTGALGASAANAAVVSEFANGVLVPHAIYESGTGRLTAVGLTSCAAGTVYWTFFDVGSKHVVDQEFNMTPNDQTAFVWGAVIQTDEPGDGHIPINNGEDGKLGYLVFVMDTNSNTALDTSDVPCLAGAAFDIRPGDDEVAFVPTLPLDAMNPSRGAGDFGSPSGGVYVGDLRNMDGVTVSHLAAGANAHDHLYLRYFIDGTPDSGADTDIYIWSAQDIRGDYVVNIYDNNQNRISVTMSLENPEVNIVDPETEFSSLPNGFNDGFILWDLGSSEYLSTVGAEDGVVSYSIIESQADAATQTIVNPIRMRDSAGNNEIRVRVDR